MHPHVSCNRRGSRDRGRSEYAVLAGVAECQPIDSYQHPQPCLLVAQGREPILEIPGLPDLDHVGIVFGF